jgi:manganese-dependent inorganic pyrophosphatase
MSDSPEQMPALVVGHRSPDMDAIAAALGYAWVLDTLGPDHYVPGRLGEINAQTTFALGRFGAAAPDLTETIAPKRRLVLVDHNEPAQSIAGLDSADLIEVLDHHRLGNAPTMTPIRFHTEPVGSTSTLVLERAVQGNLVIPAPIAGLLLCGILSDTLVFTSPTTTPREQPAARKLAVMAGLGKADQVAELDRAIAELGAGLLASGAGFGTRTDEELVNSDLKPYEANGNKAEIAQVEVAGFGELPSRLAGVQAALDHMRSAHGLALAMLTVTDIINNNSRLVVSGSPTIIAALPYARLSDGTLDAPGVVSRKKQLLPPVLDALAKG